jgi:hypothetical protein
MTSPIFAPPSASISQSRPQWISSKWAIAVTLGMVLLGSLLIPNSAHADDDKPKSSGRSTGSRGCATAVTAKDNGAKLLPAKVPALILLAPHQQRGQTIATRPTFAWFVRDRTPLPLEFRIYEQTAAGYTLLKEIKDDSLRSVPGIMVLSPLLQLPELTPGKHYRWQVELVCDAARPSGNLFAEADLSVVPLSDRVQQSLSAAQSPLPDQARLNRAQIYAQSNLWYDALAVVLPSQQDSIAIQSFRQSLLDQIAINPAEQTVLRQSTISPILPLASVQP